MKYELITKAIATDEILTTQVFNHWPCKEAWDIELSNYNVKCEIKNYETDTNQRTNQH